MKARLQRPARVIGAGAALIVVGFMFVLVGQAQPEAASVGYAYLVAAAVVLLAPRAWAAGAAIVTAVATGILTVISGAMNLQDGFILGTAALLAAWAAWDLVRHPDPDGGTPTAADSTPGDPR